MPENHDFIATTAMLPPTHQPPSASQDVKLTKGLEMPELEWIPRADTRQESTISTKKVHPLVSKISDLTATIVICTRNRPVELRSCLQAIS